MWNTNQPIETAPRELLSDAMYIQRPERQTWSDSILTTRHVRGDSESQLNPIQFISTQFEFN